MKEPRAIAIAPPAVPLRSATNDMPPALAVALYVTLYAPTPSTDVPDRYSAVSVGAPPAAGGRHGVDDETNVAPGAQKE